MVNKTSASLLLRLAQTGKIEAVGLVFDGWSASGRFDYWVPVSTT